MEWKLTDENNNSFFQSSVRKQVYVLIQKKNISQETSATKLAKRGLSVMSCFKHLANDKCVASGALSISAIWLMSLRNAL